MTLIQLQKLQREKETRKQIDELHAEYCRLTNLNIPLKRTVWDASRERPWFDFIKAGHTKEDLATVVSHIRKRIKQGRRYTESLAFRNLIVNLDLFAELLAEAKAEGRAPTYGPRERVLEATGRSAYLDTPVQTPDQVMQSSKAFEEFRKMKETLRP
jgi:hypothetical protein